MALLFDIKRFAINDGPGIRTTIFMKGCPLRCVWCHNPEGFEDRPGKMYTKKKCIGCQSCVEVCPQKNLTLTAEGIMDLGHCIACVEKERLVMEQSGGGVTMCGGEPMMHTDELCEILDELGRRGFHRTVDTTLFASEEQVRKVADRCELLLVDLKLMDSASHQRYTGVGNEKILKNIKLLSDNPQEVEVTNVATATVATAEFQNDTAVGDLKIKKTVTVNKIAPNGQAE